MELIQIGWNICLIYLDKAIHAGKVHSQSSSSLEQDVNEPESVENTEQDPNWHQTDSSDSEAQSEEGSDGDDDEEEPATKGKLTQELKINIENRN